MKNLTLCNNCAGKIVLSINEYYTRNGLIFCSEECANAFDEGDDKSMPGLEYDLGID